MFLYSNWLKLSLTTRHKIAETFGVERKKSIHVADNQVVDDGYYIQEVEAALSLEKLQVYLQSDSQDYTYLFDQMVNKLEGKVEPVAPVVEPAPAITESIPPVIEPVPAQAEPVVLEKVKESKDEKPKAKKNK